MKGANVIASILKKEGIENIGVIPYNGLEEAAAIAGIRPIIFRQERVGVNLADGLSRITNGDTIGVFSMQAGPGAENAFAGVAQAYADSVPILLLPASASRNKSAIHPTFSPWQTYKTVTKWSEQINMPNRIPEMLRRAFNLLRNGRPGPVLLDVPSDILSMEMPDLSLNYAVSRRWKSAGNLSDIRECLRLLMKAKNPIIHAGQGVLYAEATDELKEFAELTQIPVMTTLAGKSAFAENHPLALGTRANTATGPVVHYLNTSDVVFGIGCSFTKTHVGAELLEKKILIHSTNYVGDIDKEYVCSQAIIGDAKLVLQQLIDEVNSIGNWLSRKKYTDPVEDIQYVKNMWMNEWMPKLVSNETPINPYRVIWELNNFVDPYNSIVNHESGSPRDQMSPFFHAIAPRSYIGWGKSTQLGYSLGLAMGSKLACPSKLSINVMGDYAFGMVGMDLETTVREDIPILTIILNNSYMAIYGPNDFPVANQKYRTKHLTGNYSAIAEGMGSYVEKIEDPNDIRSALIRAAKVVKKGKPALLEFITCAEQSFSHKDG